MTDKSPQNIAPENTRENKPKKTFWDKIGDGAKGLYTFVKKISPQVRHLDKAFHSKDPLEITSTILNEGGKLIGGDIGNAMRFGHDITNVIDSDNVYDGTAEGITSAMRYADFGKEGNRLAKNLSNGLHNAADSQKIDQSIRNNLDKNIELARREYELKQAGLNGEYDKVLELEIKRQQVANTRRNIEEKQYAETTPDEYGNPEQSSEFNAPPVSAAQPHAGENVKTLSDAEKLTALRMTPARTGTPRRMSSLPNTQQAALVREAHIH